VVNGPAVTMDGGGTKGLTMVGGKLYRKGVVERKTSRKEKENWGRGHLKHTRTRCRRHGKNLVAKSHLSNWNRFGQSLGK